ncbi:DMT family transporter [Aliivibrio fischeri]|uniref:DMT family transporter n=1 Tax=Aliivibrio fischeri TaxID=668 RepID=UPI00080E41DD|nr:DMT family transporter [Aliivibrio fischeri]OCH39546.1 multidrug transporter [Aliivibrio fischeri]OED52850.1 multidrug transporter [Aliivibrio fischeri]
MTPTHLAIILLILGNLLASLSDVAVKVLDGGVSPFQYIFLRQLISLTLLLPFWFHQQPKLRCLSNPKVTLIRAHVLLIGSGCMVVSITYLTLATANAVFYTAPLLMIPLSILLLNERPSTNKVLQTIIGFIGVLIILRPSQFHWAAIFALGTATTLALYNILVRKIPNDQSVITTLFWTTLLSLPVSGGLAWLYWQPLHYHEVLWIALSATFIISYNGLATIAYKKAPATQISLAEYSGLIFVVIFGVIWFDEIPDILTAVGIALIVIPLMPKTWLKNIRGK